MKKACGFLLLHGLQVRAIGFILKIPCAVVFPTYRFNQKAIVLHYGFCFTISTLSSQTSASEGVFIQFLIYSLLFIIIQVFDSLLAEL